MNKVYESPTMIVHDDRTMLTPEEAFDWLWDGHAVRLCYPPDFSTENESDIYDDGGLYWLGDIVGMENMGKITKSTSEKLVYEYCIGYEIYK